MRVIPPNADLANRYAVSVRTIQRWKASGVDVSDPKAVGKHLLTLPNYNLKSLEAVTTEITEQLRHKEHEQQK